MGELQIECSIAKCDPQAYRHKSAKAKQKCKGLKSKFYSFLSYITVF